MELIFIMFMTTVSMVMAFFLGKKIGFDDGVRTGANEMLIMMGGGFEMPLDEINKPEGKVVPFPNGDDDNGGNC